jgi:hypothetical protein
MINRIKSVLEARKNKKGTLQASQLAPDSRGSKGTLLASHIVRQTPVNKKKEKYHFSGGAMPFVQINLLRPVNIIFAVD